MKETTLMAKICQKANVWPNNLYKGILEKRKQRDFGSTSKLLILLRQLLYLKDLAFWNIKVKSAKCNIILFIFFRVAQKSILVTVRVLKES